TSVAWKGCATAHVCRNEYGVIKHNAYNGVRSICCRSDKIGPGHPDRCTFQKTTTVAASAVNTASATTSTISTSTSPTNQVIISPSDSVTGSTLLITVLASAVAAWMNN
ncbi:hypothetical protein PMAYCL1PPCAC_11190, partial [Pristionchus mayeri]